MNKDGFFGYLRRASVKGFGTTLSQRQIDGIEALLDAGAGLPLHHMANVLAQVHRETGGGMYPIKETVMPAHRDKNPSDAEVIRRLDRAFENGNLPWVRTPYWRDGWFGRGQIQITHKTNYDRFGVTKDQALELPHSARIAVTGMRDGLFTGRKLADYDFPAALSAPPARNPRRIVNGQDGSDAVVAARHREFAAALEHAGWRARRANSAPVAPQRVNEAPVSERPNLLAALISRLLSFLSKGGPA